MITSTIVSNASLFVRITESVFSQHLLKTPSTPVTPIPSITSLVSLYGTCRQLMRTTKIQIKNVSEITMQDARKSKLSHPCWMSVQVRDWILLAAFDHLFSILKTPIPNKHTFSCLGLNQTNQTRPLLVRVSISLMKSSVKPSLIR